MCQPKIKARKSGAPTSQPISRLPLSSVMPYPMMIDGKSAMPGHMPGPAQAPVEQLSFSVFMWVGGGVESVIPNTGSICAVL